MNSRTVVVFRARSCLCLFALDYRRIAFKYRRHASIHTRRFLSYEIMSRTQHMGALTGNLSSFWDGNKMFLSLPLKLSSKNVPNATSIRGHTILGREFRRGARRETSKKKNLE